MNLKHHHLIYQAKVGRDDLGISEEDKLRIFLLELVKIAGMEVLIEPVFKFSKNMAWTGLIGIITSHMSFHYWTDEQYVQFDLYSCKDFDTEKVVSYLNEFWRASEQKVLFIDREQGKEFTVKVVK